MVYGDETTNFPRMLLAVFPRKIDLEISLLHRR